MTAMVAWCGFHNTIRTANLPRYRVDSFHCQARYGYVWVALEEPLLPLFDIPEDGAPGFRRIFQFYDQWQTAPLRLMENSFDNAHFSFVHRGTFGDNAQPKPSKYEIEETDYGFVATTVVDIVNPPAAYRVTGTTDPTTTRTMRNHWYLPFCRRMDMTYPSGIRHIIINCATPIDDGRIQLVQLLYRNDTEEAVPHPGADRLGRRRGLRGPRHSGSHRSGRRVGPGAPDRGAYELRPPGADHAAPVAGVVEGEQRTGGDAELRCDGMRCRGGIGAHLPWVQQTVRIGMTLEAELVGVDLLVADAVLQGENVRVGDRNSERAMFGDDLRSAAARS